MSAIIDNLIAYRILSMLVKPFDQTEAFKLGIIDAQGKVLIKPKDFETQEQRDAYNYLTRLVFNLKRIINKLPGGESKLKNIVAAFFLIREAYADRRTTINEEDLIRLIELQENGLTLVEEQLVVEDFFMCEDASGGGGAAVAAPGNINIAQQPSATADLANVTGRRVSTDQPVIRKRKPKRFQRFIVNDDIFSKFGAGKAKFRKWSSYLNLENEGEKAIYDFARKNPNGVIILHNGKNTKAIRFNRKGGGSWSKIKRPTRQVNNALVT